MTVLGVHQPGDSVVHRAPAGAKMLALAAFGAVSAFVHTPVLAAALVGVAILGFPAARIGPGAVARRIRPLAVVVVLVGAAQVVGGGTWLHAATVVGSYLALLLAATLVSLTTPTAEIVQALTRALGPLHRIGIDPDRAGLLLALGIRAVPQVVDLARTVRDAQRARGLTADPRAFAVPLIVRSLRQADLTSDALRARGIDD
jgi:biotin transport system permease protein